MAARAPHYHESEDSKLEQIDSKHDAGAVSVHDPAHGGELDQAEQLVHDHDEFTPQEYKKLMLKVDLILMPMLMIIYGLQYSDKTSLSSGVVFGLREETGLVGNQFGNLSSFFYMSYAVAQYPMAWVLQKVPLGRGLAVCVILWGIMVMCLGVCNNYAQLAAVRTLLGWFESVGFAVYTSTWWLRREQGLRQGLYYSMNTFFAMVFGVGIYYIGKNARENGGPAGWRVINYFLGGVTIGMGILFFIFGGTPDEVWWLSKREKRMAKARIVENGTGSAQYPWKWHQVRECFRDPQYWFAIMFNLLGNIPNGGITTFQTLVYRGFGFNELESIIYQLPSFALTFSIIVIVSILIRYYPNLRWPITILVQVIATFVLLFVGLSNVGRWAKWAVWMFCLVYSLAAFIAAWPMISINVAGRTKKSFFGASSLLAYCVGNIIGSQIFLPSDAPKYHKGLIGCAICLACSILLSIGWWFHYKRQNKERDAYFLEHGISMEERMHRAQINGELDLTDMENKEFVYMT